MKKPNGKQYLYLPDVLTKLRAETGRTFVAICSGGAAVSTPSGGAATFQEMLEHVPRGVRFLVSIICGNDYYGQKVKPVTDHMEAAIADYCFRASTLATVHLAVTGMPSDVWSYKTWMTSTSWQQYDSNSATFRALFEEHKAVAITGGCPIVSNPGGGQSGTCS